MWEVSSQIRGQAEHLIQLDDAIKHGDEGFGEELTWSLQPKVPAAASCSPIADYENLNSQKIPVVVKYQIHPITFWKTRFLNNHIFTFPCGIQFIWLPTFFETLERFPTGFVENMTLINWGTTVSLALAKNEDEWHDGLKDLTSDQLSQHKVHMTDRDPRVCRWPEHSRQSARAGDNFSSLVRLLNWKLLLRRTYQNMA